LETLPAITPADQLEDVTELLWAGAAELEDL